MPPKSQQTVKFTVVKIKGAYNDTGKNFYLYDSEVKGLRLKISKTGYKSYQFQGWSRDLGKTVTQTIGHVAKVGLQEARDKATAYMVKVNSGVDLEEERRERKQINTFDEAFRLWIKGKEKKGHRDIKTTKNRYALHIKRRFGSKKLNDITKGHIEQWFLNLPEKSDISGPTANRVLAIVGGVYRARKGIDNPTTGIERFGENKRDRYLNGVELKRLHAALQDGETTGWVADLVRLGLATGARQGNLLKMRWNDVRDDLWTIPAVNAKGKKDIHVPLNGDALDVLQRRKKGTCSVFVFPQNKDYRRPWYALLKRANLENFKFHDLRHTAASYMAMSGADLLTIAQIFGHANTKTTERYAHLSYKHKAAAAAAGANAMAAAMAEEAVKGLPQKVVKINTGE